MSRRPPLTDRAIRDSLGGAIETPSDLVRSISDYAHSTPQPPAGILGWLGQRPPPAGSRTVAVVVLLVGLLMLAGIAALVGSRPQPLNVVRPSVTELALPAGWSHVADLPRDRREGVYGELGGLLVLANAEHGELRFVDPAAIGDGEVARLDLGANGRGLPSVRDADGWWIGTGTTHELLRFDPATRTIVRRLQIGTEAYNLAADGPIVYVTDFENGRLSRVDTSTGEVTATRDLVQAAGVAVLPGGRVLVASRPGSLLLVDPVTLDPLEEIAVQGDVMTLLPDGDRVIITRNNADRLSTIDPRRLAAGERLTETRISAFTLTDDAAWAIDWNSGDLLRLDRETLAVVERVPALSEGQDGVAVVAGDLWIEGTAGDEFVVHRLRRGP